MPFQRSTNVPSFVDDELVLPTAVHASGAEHDTEASDGNAPVGFGMVSADQLEPFQRRANGLFPLIQTAMQLVAVAHDTALSAPAGGVSESIHDMPSHCHAVDATAMHNVLLGHEMLRAGTPGAATTDQLTPFQLSASTLLNAFGSVV
ncbi:MAG: hypothetical protein ACRDHW_08305 [Ktedonobacteraceae bacterium]